MTIIGNNNNIEIQSNSLSVNGKKYHVPKGFKFNNVNIINGIVTIKGYTLKEDTFVKNSFINKIKSLFKGR